jgi:hypothetical protein
MYNLVHMYFCCCDEESSFVRLCGLLFFICFPEYNSVGVCTHSFINSFCLFFREKNKINGLYLKTYVIDECRWVIVASDVRSRDLARSESSTQAEWTHKRIGLTRSSVKNFSYVFWFNSSGIHEYSENSFMVKGSGRKLAYQLIFLNLSDYIRTDVPLIFRVEQFF